MSEVKGYVRGWSRPRVLTTDVILDVGASLKVISRHDSMGEAGDG
jgi:hypothetical protein